jgi:hypothetical protein
VLPANYARQYEEDNYDYALNRKHNAGADAEKGQYRLNQIDHGGDYKGIKR